MPLLAVLKSEGLQNNQYWFFFGCDASEKRTFWNIRNLGYPDDYCQESGFSAKLSHLAFGKKADSLLYEPF
ncbi:MAG: hypothetical protein IPN76_24230 [Saprospiraceae bacterium]|nr:hypothetical protein [Saprospiraceae bacterium]